MNGTVNRMKSSILARACALVTIATLGTTLIATAPASARPPRPGARACTLGTVDGGLSVTDGTVITITLAVPPSQGGGTATIRYECDNGTWVKIARVGVVVSGTSVPARQLATAVIHSGNETLAVKLRGPAVKAIIGPNSRVASHVAW
jgi:hypothetical protein